jgi:hypothetical protein
LPAISFVPRLAQELDFLVAIVEGRIACAGFSFITHGHHHEALREAGCDRIGLGVRRRLLGLWFDLCQSEADVLAATIVAPVGNASQLGAGSVLRESPDLQLGLHGDVLYAEVKRFYEKEQDRLNDRAMQEVPDDLLVRLDDPTETEGKTAWEQMVDVAIRKAPVYMEGAANILVFESDSECLDLMVNSAVHEYDERALASDDPRLRRLNGMMLVNRGRTSGRPIPSSVEFCQTQHAAVPLNERLAAALGGILAG